MGDSVKKPLISVIVPIYKVEKYLQKCIDSILNQTYENLEIILVDDGSPDNCPRICDDYARQDKRIIVIHKVNGGVSDARNVGIKKSRGEYVMFVDSDDWIESNYVETMFEGVRRHDYDFAISGVSYVLDNQSRRNECVPKSKNIVELTSNSLIGYSSNKIYKKNIIKRQFENSDREDLLFNLGIFADNPECRYGVIKSCGYNYYQREDSSLHVSRAAEKEKVCDCLQRLYDTLNATNFTNDVCAEVFNCIAYAYITDSFLIFTDQCKSNAEITDYVQYILLSVSKNSLKISYANNRLYIATWLAYKTHQFWLYSTYLRIIRRRKK